MKVIAEIESKKYICEIHHSEIEKFLDQYYNELKLLKVGDKIDLSKGYDFLQDTKEALNKTEEFIKSNQKTIKTILEGFNILGDQKRGIK